MKKKPILSNSGQQFHQYQQNEQAAQLVEHKNHDIQSWKSRLCLGTGTKMWQGLTY